MARAAAMPRSSWPWSTSRTTTGRPRSASAQAMPAPMVPAPSTAGRSTGSGAAERPQRSFRSRSRLKNIRIRLRPARLRTRSTKAARSASRPASITVPAVPATTSSAASGASSCSLPRAMSCLASSACSSLTAGAGIRRSGPSGAGAAASSSSTARSRSPRAAQTVANPSSTARGPSMGWPPQIICRARAAPTSRGSRWVPPQPGISPRVTSGRPSVQRRSSETSRQVVVMANSSPPPRQAPSITLTVGTRRAASRLNSRCPRPMKASATSGRMSVRSSPMSAPAMKQPGLALRNTTARMSRSARMSSRRRSSSSSTGVEKVFTLEPGWSKSTSRRPPGRRCVVMVVIAGRIVGRRQTP